MNEGLSSLTKYIVHIDEFQTVVDGKGSLI